MSLNYNGPVAEICKVCERYQCIDQVLEYIEAGIPMSKSRWKTLISNIVDGRDHARWRFTLHLYPKLHVFRTVIQKCQPTCWWYLSKSLPYLKRPCVTVVRILSGSNVLAVVKETAIPHNERLCRQCDQGVIENEEHFLLECDAFQGPRNAMLKCITRGLSVEGSHAWNRLSCIMKMYILLGMEYPLSVKDLWLVRIISCIWVDKMYRLRLLCEQ